MKLTLRKIKGKYYQAGYRENNRWVNVLHLGTADQIVLDLNRSSMLQKAVLNLFDEINLMIKANIPKKYQNKDDKEKA